MIKLSYLSVCPVLTSVYLLFALFPVYAVDSDFIQKVQETERLAYSDVNDNKITDALQKLIELFRSVPENDVESAEVLLGPLHLYSFIISEFYRPEFLYKAKLLQENQYPSDKLLMSIACLNNTTTRMNMAVPVTNWLNELKQGDNLTIRFLAEVVSVYALTSEEGKNIQKGMGSKLATEMNNLYVNLFLENYPTSTVSQFVLQDLLDRGVEKVISEYGIYDAGKLVQTYIETPEKLNLLAGFNNAGVSAQKLNTCLSGFNEVASVLPSMNLFDINEKVLRKWVEMLREEKDMNTRYTLITFLKCGGVLNKDCQELVKTALKEASIRKEVTSDVLYAKITLLKLAMKNYWIKEAEETLMDISQLEVLPPIHGIQSAYAQQKKLIEGGTEYFVKLGYYDIAKKALEVQSAKYHDSHYEMGVKSKLVKLEKYPTDYSLELISRDTSRSRMHGRSDLIRKYYDEIVEHTPNPDLKNILANHDVSQPLKYNIDHTAVVQSSIQDKVREMIELQNAYKAQQN